MKKLVALLAATAGISIATLNAEAGDRWSVSFGGAYYGSYYSSGGSYGFTYHGPGVYVAPRAYYCYPAPRVFYYSPPVYYYYAPPVILSPAPVYHCYPAPSYYATPSLSFYYQHRR